MTSKPLILGIGGLARSGKDTMCAFLIDELWKNAGISSKRMALADELKTSIRPYLLEKYSIDVLSCTPEQKEIIRPELVDFGKKFRESTQGTHWTKILENKIKDTQLDVVIVPDIRYNLYPSDEVAWVKSKGLLIHVSRYEFKDGEKIWNAAPNEDERINDPLVRAAADFSVAWETKNHEELRKEFNGFAQMITIVILNELSRIKRRAIDS